MVDVVVPVYRPDDKLVRLIEKLNHQTVRPGHIFFMQTLTGTEEDERVRETLSRADNAVVTEIDKREFDHGGTRNRGAAMSQAEFLLFMTQDAVPVDEDLIANLLEALRPERVAAAYGRQLADENAGVVERYTREFNYPPESSRKSAADMDRLGIILLQCVRYV